MINRLQSELGDLEEEVVVPGLPLPRLRAALKRAAERAGYSSWWIAEDLAASVGLFLQLQYPEQVVESRTLDGAVKSALRKVGYADIARYFVSRVSRRRVSLTACLPRKPNQNLSRFLENLAAKVDALRTAGVCGFHFHGLQKCASRLESANSGEGPGSRLREIIVAFVRQRLNTRRGEVGCECLID